MKFKVGDNVIHLASKHVHTIYSITNNMYWVDISSYFREEDEMYFELEERYNKIQQFNKEMKELINPGNRAVRRNHKYNELLTHGVSFEKKQRNTSRRI